MFWDGTRWVDERSGAPQPSHSPRSRSRQARDWILTLPILALVPALLGPWTSAGAVGPSLQISGEIAAGAPVTVTGTRFDPRQWIRLEWDGGSAGMPRARTDSRGDFGAQMVIPSYATTGVHTIAAYTDPNGRGRAVGRQDASAAAGRLAATILAEVTVVVAAPSSSPTIPPTAPPSPTPVVSPSPDPTATPTPVPSATDVPSPSITPVPTATATDVPSPSITPVPTATATATPTPTPVPTSTARPTPTPTPVPRPTTTPTPTPVPTTTACGTLQGRISGAASGSVLDLSGCTYTMGATVDRPLTIRGATIRPPAGTKGLVVTASHVTLDRLTILGPQSRTFNGTDFGVYASKAISDLAITNSEIGNFGYGAVYANNVTGLVVQGDRIHDCVYAGIMALSSQNGRISGNTVQRIGVYGASANDNNAYGIILSAIVGHPMTSGFVVSGNTITDVPTWHALDTHGGQHIAFTDNKVYRSSRALFITTGANGERATDVTVTGNLFGSPDPVTFNIMAVTTVNTDSVTITHNTISGWSGETFQDYGGRSTDLVFADNSITP